MALSGRIVKARHAADYGWARIEAGGLHVLW